MSYSVKNILFLLCCNLVPHLCSAGVNYLSSAPQVYGVQVGLQHYPTFLTPFSRNGEYSSDFYYKSSDSEIPSKVGDSGSDITSEPENEKEEENLEFEENTEENLYSNTTEVPLELIAKLNEFGNIEDALQHLVENYEPPPSIASRFGGSAEDEEEERSHAIKAKPANCQPQLTVIKLIESNDPSVVYLPSCTRLEQCGGCCSHYLTECHPTETEIVNFVVHKAKYTGGNKLKYVGKEIVVKEKHIKCKCGCKMKAEECKGFRQFDPNYCTCTCPNKDERQKCNKDPKKLWNPKLCSCQCREVLNCTTTERFDPLKCQCVLDNKHRRSNIQNDGINGNNNHHRSNNVEINSSGNGRYETSGRIRTAVIPYI